MLVDKCAARRLAVDCSQYARVSATRSCDSRRRNASCDDRVRRESPDGVDDGPPRRRLRLGVSVGLWGVGADDRPDRPTRQSGRRTGEVKGSEDATPSEVERIKGGEQGCAGQRSRRCGMPACQRSNSSAPRVIQAAGSACCRAACAG
jgi:hypothetical protein